MDDILKKRLVDYLNMMRKDELNEFLHWLPKMRNKGCSSIETLTQPEMRDEMEVASWMMTHYGELTAWKITLRTWKRMGLSRLSSRAETDAALIPVFRFSLSAEDFEEKEQNITEELFLTRSLQQNKFLQQNFTKLQLLSRYQVTDLESLTWYNHMTEKFGQLIEIENLFIPHHLGPERESHTVILHGDPGIGKSTLAKQVRGAWEEGQLYRDHFQHVFYFNCRDLIQFKELSLAELIREDWPTSITTMRQILSQPEKLLFIFDDIDELQWNLTKDTSDFCLHWSQKQSVHTLINSFLMKTVLPGSFLLITVRSTNLERFILPLKLLCCVEVLGYCESGRETYFYKYFSNENQANKAISLLKSNQALWTMCFIPWVSWLVCTCLKQQINRRQEISLTCQTITDLCLQFLSQTLPAHLFGMKMCALCSLAYEENRKTRKYITYFTFKKRKLDKIAKLILFRVGVLQRSPTSLSYRFTHRCFQEFFLAMTIILRFSEISNSDSDNIDLRRYIEMFLSNFGVKDMFMRPIIWFLFGFLSERGLQELERIFGFKLSLEKKWKVLNWSQENFFQEDLPIWPIPLKLFYSLYEIQDQEFLTEVMNKFQGKNIFIQTNMDFLVVTFCIKFCSHVIRLQVNENGHIWINPNVILITRTPVTDTCWQILFSISGLMGSLEELDLSGNFLSCSAVQNLCEAMSFPNCHLRILWLDNCGLKYSCCQDLASMLKTTSLRELSLEQNDLGSRGLRKLCEGLGHPSCQLQLLWYSTVEGCCDLQKPWE